MTGCLLLALALPSGPPTSAAAPPAKGIVRELEYRRGDLAADPTQRKMDLAAWAVENGADVAVSGRELFWDKTLMGTFYGAGRPKVDFPWLLDLYMDGRLKLDELITKYRPLEEVNEAFEDMNRGITARTILTFD